MKKYWLHYYFILAVLFINTGIAKAFPPNNYFLLLSNPAQSHNCRMYGFVNHGIANEILRGHLVDNPCSLKKMSENVNEDGWGISYYDSANDEVIIRRGGTRAFLDAEYDSLVNYLDSNPPRSLIAHIRNCSSGCCCDGCDSIPDPHPFYRHKFGKLWTFVHNGVADKHKFIELVGEQYLLENPPNGSGIPECDPSDTSLVVDSELLFTYLLKHIEENGGDASRGLNHALIELKEKQISGIFNFILSDGHAIWAYRDGESLYYIHAPAIGYTAVASRYPGNTRGAWIECSSNQLIIIEPGTEPLIVDIGNDFDLPPAELPGKTTLYGNYPNPFNQRTNIPFYIHRGTHITIDIYNLLGQHVGNPLNQYLPRGYKTITWDSDGLPGGIYFYRMTAGETSITNRMLILK
ncbi:MAG: T9SS type A sorting domain-containing protein [candidate division Zixibacteria bacterium]|nr:T9SS type A sorting domain-containing protein [candidate division Zixibacteria bacterium]